MIIDDQDRRAIACSDRRGARSEFLDDLPDGVLVSPSAQLQRAC
ncbi:hypothetical protein ACFQZ4_49225 [Catellatospora coxensis]|nr:hypothetical protein [Catellatospora coxensis]